MYTYVCIINKSSDSRRKVTQPSPDCRALLVLLYYANSPLYMHEREKEYLSTRFLRAPPCCAVGRFISRRVRATVDVWTFSALTSRRSAGTASLWILSIFTLASWIYTMWPICTMGMRKGEREREERERERERERECVCTLQDHVHVE